MDTRRLALEVSPEIFREAQEELWAWVVDNIIDEYPVDFCDEPIAKIIKILQKGQEAQSFPQ